MLQTQLSKTEQLKTELNYIKNERIRMSAEFLVNNLPDYFFEVPASSTGKYHPASSLGLKGLLRHTKLVVRLAYEMLYQNNTLGELYSTDEKDLMILGLLIHDGLKLGEVQEKYTRLDHPLLISEFVTKHQDNLQLNEKEIKLVKDVVESHMGEWTRDREGNEVLPKPITRHQRFVHMCDFLASRRWLDATFDNDEIL